MSDSEVLTIIQAPIAGLILRMILADLQCGAICLRGRLLLRRDEQPVLFWSVGISIFGVSLWLVTMGCVIVFLTVTRAIK